MAKNEKLLSNEVKLYWVDGNTTMKAPLPSKTDCHFLHNSEEMTAALSDCHDGFSGHILQSGHILGMYLLSMKSEVCARQYVPAKDFQSCHILCTYYKNPCT